MKKELKEVIVKNVELLKSFLNLSDDFFEKKFGCSKETAFDILILYKED